MKKFTALLILVFTFMSYSGLLSEDSKKSSNRLLEFYKNEKLLFTPTQLNEAVKNIDVIRQSVSEFKEKKKKILTSGEYEKVVSNNSKPESEIFAAINPTDSNNIIISPMKYDVSNMMEGLMLPIYYSKDFGKTWGVSSFRSKPVDPTAFVAGGGDPMFAFDANGKAYFSWINLYVTIVGSSADSAFASMFWVSSEDGGKNWDRYPNDAVASIKAKYNQNGALMGLDGMHDKQWMAVDKSNSAYRNNLYTALVRFDIEGVSQDATIIVKRKLSNKNEFEPEEVVVSKGNYELVQFSSIDTDNSGNVHVTFFGMNGTYKAFYHAVSKNGGSSFETETKISEYNFSGGQMLGGTEYESIPGVNFARLMPSPQFAIDKSNSSTAGNMYMVWTADGVDSKMNTDYDIYITKSVDGGTVWTTPKIVNAEAKGQQYYPTLTVNEDGVVIVGWYDRRNHIGTNNTDFFITYSHDGGENFVEDMRVTAQPTNFSYVGFLNNDFGIGEYNPMLATKGYAIPVWSDGRINDGNMNVYIAFVPITKTGSSVERMITMNAGFVLNDPMPNPAQNQTMVSFTIERSSKVELTITDINGNLINKIASESFAPGEYNFNIPTGHISSGTYFVNIHTEFGYSVKKLIVL